MRQNGERGAILVLVLLVMIALLGLGLAALYATNSGVRVAATLNLKSEARVVAESGLERAKEVLLDLDHSPPASVLLAGARHPLDVVPASTFQCGGEARGAVLVDRRGASPAYLAGVGYPSSSRLTDLPAGASHQLASKLGTYTVYVRQDVADCRMGNFICEADADQRGAELPCEVPAGAPQPNGYVVVTVVGTANDGRTTEILEETVRLSRYRTAMVGGTGGVGGAAGTGGAGGLAAVGAGGAAAAGTGGSGSAGSTGTSVCVPCLMYAVQAVAPCSGTTVGCVTVNRGSEVDAYSSCAGDPGPTNQSPASIAMTCTSWEAAPSCPVNCPSGCVSGAIVYAQTPQYDARTLPTPAHVVNAARLVSPPAATIRAGGSTVYYEEITLNRGGSLTLKAGHYVVNNLNLNEGSTLTIDDSRGRVVVWVQSYLSPSSAVVVKSGKPEGFWLVYNGTNQVNNNTNDDFTGVIFAPSAEVNLNYRVRGAVVGGKVTLNGLASVHFDTHMQCP